jgi:hypothetical protein
MTNDRLARFVAHFAENLYSYQNPAALVVRTALEVAMDQVEREDEAARRGPPGPGRRGCIYPKCTCGKIGGSRCPAGGSTEAFLPRTCLVITPAIPGGFNVHYIGAGAKLAWFREMDQAQDYVRRYGA